MTECPANPDIYHITHANNLPGILAAGGIWCDAGRLGHNIRTVNLGYQRIKERRMKKRVSLCRQGVLGDYVPFYFCNRSPMLYAIHGGYVEGYSAGQTYVIYLKSSIQTLRNAGCDWFFTDGHAVEAISRYYQDSDRLDQLDWNIIADLDWANNEWDNDRKRRKQAECLVHDFFRWEWVEQVGVISPKARDWAESQLQLQAHRPPVEIHREWYY